MSGSYVNGKISSSETQIKEYFGNAPSPKGDEGPPEPKGERGPLVLRVQQVLRVLRVPPGQKVNEVPLVLKGLLVRREVLV